VEVQWADWYDITNDAFVPFVENKDRYLIFYGGRGSSKSDFACKKLIFRCLNEEYFRFILVRNTYNTIKDSSYQTLKDTIFDLGLESLFKFRVQPLEIECLNGNKFIARGCDNTQTLKSVKDPTGVWWEEDIPTESDFITITTSIRTIKADYLQEIFTINPEVEGNYEDHWFWIRFFKGQDKQSFNSETTVKITEKVSTVLKYTVHHSTYKDNVWIPLEFIGFLMDMKEYNPYYYTVYCLGNWGNRQMGGLFYKQFNRGKNTDTLVRYNPDLAIHLSFDFNVNPFMSATVWQVVGKVAYCIDEIATKSPDNTTKGCCAEFTARYYSHNSGLFIYGDPSGRQEDTRSDVGFNDYTIIEQELERFRPALRVASKHPPVVMRGNFINEIFRIGYEGVNIIVAETCRHLINDFTFGKEASDGTKLKEKTKEEGVTFEKYFHHSDTMDYFICEAFVNEFEMYQFGKAPKRAIHGQKTLNRKHGY